MNEDTIKAEIEADADAIEEIIMDNADLLTAIYMTFRQKPFTHDALLTVAYKFTETVNHAIECEAERRAEK